MACPLLATPHVRFWARVDRAGECWLWTGPRDRKGYGTAALGGKVHIRAHRFAFEASTGTPPGALFVCHRCDNPSCVRPSHLFLGTHADNMRDAVEKGRFAKHPTPRRAAPKPPRPEPLPVPLHLVRVENKALRIQVEALEEQIAALEKAARPVASNGDRRARILAAAPQRVCRVAWDLDSAREIARVGLKNAVPAAYDMEDGPA